MAEKMKIPSLRFPEFSSDWESIQLNELLEFKNGINASKEQYGRGTKFINVLDILENDFIEYDRIIGNVDIDNKTLSKYAVNYGDILFQRSSETREEVGTACVYLDEERTATFGGFVIRGKKIGEYEPIFLNHLLKTDSARKEITSRSGGSTRYNVGQETLASIIVLMPSRYEQEKIAKFFTLIDQKLYQLKRKKTLLEEYRKGVLQKIFSQEIRFRDDSGQEFPKWEKKKLGKLCKLRNGYAFKSNTYVEDGSFKVITISNVQDGELDLTELKTISVIPSDIRKFQILSHGDLLVSMTGNVGRVARLNSDNCLLNQRVGKLEPVNIRPDYIYHFLRNGHFISHMISLAQGGAQPNLSKDDIDTYLVDVPTNKEQFKIANFLSSIDNKINQTKTQIEKSELWKKGLLQKMFV